jgi:predicted Ser/Thr protein kinase
MDYKYFPYTLLNQYKLIHKNKKERIYLMPDNKVLKICKNIKDCRREYLVLRYANLCQIFPDAYEYRQGYIIREYVEGICLIEYLKKNPFDKELALSLISLYDELSNLKFKRLDTGISHIFITKDKKLKLVGLKNSCWHEEKYPCHMINGLKRLKVSKQFFKILNEERPELYKEWVKS